MRYTVPRIPKESLQTYQSAPLWQTGLLNPTLSFHLYFEWLAQLHVVRALQNRNTIFQNCNSDNMILVNHFLKNFPTREALRRLKVILRLYVSR